ncbi:hypothetical protein Tco_0353616 [Tanacetum coccineum]
MSHPKFHCSGRLRMGTVTSWREEDLIREIDLYMPIYQCRLHIFFLPLIPHVVCLDITRSSVLNVTTQGQWVRSEQAQQRCGCHVLAQQPRQRQQPVVAVDKSWTSCPLTEKELHQLRMDEEALKEMLKKEAMNIKEQEEKN